MAINQRSNTSGSNKKNPAEMLTEITSGGTDSILASLFRTIATSYSISTAQWNKWMDDYLTDPSNGFKQNTTDLSTARGNLNKELFKNNMTWRKFCMCMRFIQIVRFDICVRAYHSNGKVVDHIKKINLSTMRDLPEEGEEK
jgi:hypothetical protein